MKLKKIPIKFEHFQLVGIFLMFKEHYKKYAVQVLYPEKSRIGVGPKKTNFLQIFLACHWSAIAVISWHCPNI
jgi:hypothetical protein